MNEWMVGRSAGGVVVRPWRFFLWRVFLFSFRDAEINYLDQMDSKVAVTEGGERVWVRRKSGGVRCLGVVVTGVCVLGGRGCCPLLGCGNTTGMKFGCGGGVE